MRPPPLPPRLRFARIDGISMLVMGGLTLLITAFSLSLGGFLMGGALCIAGHIELDGHKMFAAGDMRHAQNNLCTSQIGILTVLWIYCIVQLFSLNDAALSPDLKQAMSEAGADMNAAARIVHDTAVAIYLSIMLTSAVYQGVLARYYYRVTQRIIDDEVFAGKPTTSPR